MKLIRVLAQSGDARKVVWVSSQAMAGAARKKFTQENFRRDEIVTKEFEFDSNKTGILELLNRQEKE